MTTVKDPARKRALVLRLKRIEGQLRGIQRLLEEDEDCEKVAQQLAAARKALDKAYQELLACMLEEAVLDPDQDSNATLSRVRSIFTKYT